MEKRKEKITVRITTELKNQLQQQADKDRRTLADYIFYMLLDTSTERKQNGEFSNNLEKPIFKA